MRSKPETSTSNKNEELWNQILNFDLDDPPTEYGFSTRLARENFWTKEFTQKAVLEYKRFMYLAATSDQMVSPSEVVDQVWHQHLIFTQSYQAFCVVLGKPVQHIPSTQNRDEVMRFRLAKERTKELYKEAFGEQQSAIWNYTTMYEALHLPKARFNLRTFLVLGIVASVILLPILFIALRPLYVQIGNPYFVIGYVLLAVASITTLELWNKRRLRQMVAEFDPASFVFHLQPLELVYLQTQKLSSVINGVLNELIEKGNILVHPDATLESTRSAPLDSIEELQGYDELRILGRSSYSTLLRRLSRKPLFTNTASCMDAFKKYTLKSKKFGRIFYINFCILTIVFELGIGRLATGILRDKPVTQIFVVCLVFAGLSTVYLSRLTTLLCTDIIPAHYKREILPTTDVKHDWQWQYFLFGPTVLSASFAPMVTQSEQGGSNASSCSTSCGSSCGSSCSSCGGCGGGGD